MIAELCLASLVLYGTLRYFKWKNSPLMRLIKQVPGPAGYPIVGMLPLIPKEVDKQHEYFQSTMVKEYGRIWRFSVWNRSGIAISSPEDMETILSSQKLIDKGDLYKFIHPWLGDGLLLATGNKWRKNRRLLTPAFHFQILDNFFDVFNKNAEIFCDLLAEELSSTNGKAKEIDIFPYLKRSTLDVICETAMGINVNAQREDSAYLTAVHKVAEIMTQKLFSLWQFSPEWMYKHFSSQGRELYEHLNLMHSFTSKVIEERKREFAEGKMDSDEDSVNTADDDISFTRRKRRAFLDLILIEAQKGADFSDTDIRNEVDTFMFEGHDTTAAAMVWFLYCMGINPKHQELVREELDQVFGESDRSCTMKDAAQLKYLELCIKEALRLYPSVPAIERKISEDVQLSNYKLAAGTSIFLHFYALHRHEDFFPDPLTFKPERFLSDTGKHPYAFLPFSAGPRNCIGQKFALLEEKVILSSLLRRFRFTYDLAKHGPAKPCAELILKPKNGMPLLITHR